MGLLRRGCERGHVPEHCNWHNAAFQGILGSFQPNDRGSAFGHWQDRRPPVLQAELVYGGKGGGALCAGTPWGCDGASCGDPLHTFSAKQAMLENALPIFRRLKVRRPPAKDKSSDTEKPVSELFRAVFAIRCGLPQAGKAALRGKPGKARKSAPRGWRTLPRRTQGKAGWSCACRNRTGTC